MHHHLSLSRFSLKYIVWECDKKLIHLKTINYLLFTEASFQLIVTIVHFDTGTVWSNCINVRLQLYWSNGHGLEHFQLIIHMFAIKLWYDTANLHHKNLNYSTSISLSSRLGLFYIYNHYPKIRTHFLLLEYFNLTLSSYPLFWSHKKLSFLLWSCSVAFAKSVQFETTQDVHLSVHSTLYSLLYFII